MEEKEMMPQENHSERASALVTTGISITSEVIWTHTYTQFGRLELEFFKVRTYPLQL